jgi:hypothetical protein
MGPRVRRDDERGLSFSRHGFVRGLSFRSRPPKREGARAPQKRARGKPGARCTHGLMCIVDVEKLHMSIQVQRKHSGLPCAMALRLIRAVPGGRAVPPSPARCASIIANLTPALVRQDHTISPYAVCRPSACKEHVAALPRPPHPAPNVRDGHETPLLGARDGSEYAGDLRGKNTEIFFPEGLDCEAKSPPH